MTVPQEYAFLAQMDAAALADLLIVSQVDATVGDALNIVVEPAQGEKCARCWKVLPALSGSAVHPTLCRRCAQAVANLIPEA